MKKSYRASNFLDTLDKYAKRKRKDAIEDIKKIEELELKKAEEEIIQDANNMINKKLLSMKHKVSIELSRKELEERKKFFKTRKEIMEDIMQNCKVKLLDFVDSSNYESFLIKSANQISKILDSNDVTLFVKKQDFKYENAIKKAFGKDCEIKEVTDIKIGGIKGYSPSKSILVDETLDTKLKQQEDWAIETFGVKLV